MLGRVSPGIQARESCQAFAKATRTPSTGCSQQHLRLLCCMARTSWLSQGVPQLGTTQGGPHPGRKSVDASFTLEPTRQSWVGSLASSRPDPPLATCSQSQDGDSSATPSMHATRCRFVSIILRVTITDYHLLVAPILWGAGRPGSALTEAIAALSSRISWIYTGLSFQKPLDIGAS